MSDKSKKFRRLYIPLPFWCTRSTGAALPIVALQFHTVQCIVTWNRLDTLVVNGAGLAGGSIDTTSILAQDPSYIWPVTGSTVKNLRGGSDWIKDQTNMKFEPFRTVVRPGEQEHYSRGGGQGSTMSHKPLRNLQKYVHLFT
jgi:hypothetical protein